MKKTGLGFLVLLASCTMAWAQAGGEPQNPPKKAPEQRPTLGPPTGPSPSGPQTSQTTDPRKLLRIRSIYVDQMDNRLNVQLIESLGKSGRFRIVDNRDEADGILRGTCFDSSHLKTVHSEVFLTDRVTGQSVWQDNIHEHYMPPPLNRAVDSTAALIVQHLMASIEGAEHR